MLDVVGGVYFEFCAYPVHSALLGSAGRAVAALGALSDGLRLHAPVEPQHRETLALNLASAISSLEIVSVDAASTPRFSYLHTLSNPDIRDVPRERQTFTVKGDNVLRFGMLDADAVVHGRNVVYDPQSPDRPASFRANGSSAERLAVVCNRGEALRLSGKSDVAAAGPALMASEGAAAVIIKDGPWGLHWFDGKSDGWISAVQTDTVFKIGSGDVFSAMFAHCWAERGMGASAAAESASWAAAHYCRHRALPLPGMNEIRPTDQPKLANVKVRNITIYIAAPFFTLAQRWHVEETRSALIDMGARTFSPLHDVGKGSSDHHVATADLDGLLRCDVALALVDGLDAGTIFEIGYARARGIPVVAYSDTLEERNATMLRGTDCDVVDDYGSAVYRAIWRGMRA